MKKGPIMKTAFTAILCLMGIIFPAATHAHIEKLKLDNGVVQAEVTPDIGGRLLSFSLAKKANLLKVGEPVVKYPRPDVHPGAEYIGYLGHEIWAGPQSEWWAHQTFNPQRAAEKAAWPPDPYVTFAKNTILEKSSQTIILQSPDSPVSGLSFTKRYSLLNEKKNSLELTVTAKNIRNENVSWDIWFNTRTDANTQLYIPVSNVKDIREQAFDENSSTPLAFAVNNGIFTLDVTTPPVGRNKRKGKLLIQPTHGWMAAFRGDQLFIIQFEHQPQSAIHPEQGQVEIYGDFSLNRLTKGYLELEVHAPYRTLAASQTMNARELWTVLPYSGESTPQAQLAFLREQKELLGLGGL